MIHHCGKHARDGYNFRTEEKMKLTEFFRAELDREVERSRKALEQVPDGQYNWKPHEKSMIFGYMADMVATMPSWLAMAVTKDELDIAPTDGSTMKQAPKETSAALLSATNTVTLTVNGAPSDAYRDLPLQDGQEIVIRGG